MLQQLYLVSLLVFSVSALGFGIFAISKNPRSPVVRLWFVHSIFIFLWSILLYFSLVLDNEKVVILLHRLLHVSAIFIPVLFFHFVVRFTFSLISNVWLWFGYIYAAVIAVLLLTTNLLLGGVVPNAGFEYWVEVTPYFYLFIVFFWFYVLFAAALLVRAIRRYGGIMRRKYSYVLVAIIIGYAGAGTNFLPQYIDVFPYGQLIAWVYPILITIGIYFDTFKIKLVTE